MNLLQDIVIVDFSQFLSGPSAALRLADMGAQVIKVERPGTGDICRELYVSDVMIEGESTIFHTINRNKQSYAVDLKNPDDLAKVKLLLAKADVMMHNFRPGVMERIGLDYETVKQINPGIVYAEVSGYGTEGPWRDLPGQDLLLQSASGLTWLSNNHDEDPTPMGVAVVDIMAGTHVAQGILAALYKKGISGEGALIQVSMFESILDFQFEVLTSYYNDGRQLPVRGAVNSAHAYIAAPYGIYKTNDSYIALAMTNIPAMAELLQCEPLKQFTDWNDWFSKRDQIKKVLADHLATRSTACWLEETHLMGASVHYNYDIAALNRKVIKDMKNAQYADGKIPEIAPEFTAFTPPFDESPEWGSAAIIYPWYNYQWYGDKETLLQSYEMMKAYVIYLRGKANNNILSHGLGDWFDISPKKSGFAQMTKMGVTGTAIFYYDLSIMIKVAAMLKKTEDVKFYQQLAAEVKTAFNNAFFDQQKMQYDSSSQTANAMALYMDLVEEKNRQAVVDALIREIKGRNNALTAGDIGYRYVLKALEQAGRSDVIFDMNYREDVPGYGFQLKHGATALTES